MQQHRVQNVGSVKSAYFTVSEGRSSSIDSIYYCFVYQGLLFKMYEMIDMFCFLLFFWIYCCVLKMFCLHRFFFIIKLSFFLFVLFFWRIWCRFYKYASYLFHFSCLSIGQDTLWGMNTDIYHDIEKLQMMLHITIQNDKWMTLMDQLCSLKDLFDWILSTWHLCGQI